MDIKRASRIHLKINLVLILLCFINNMYRRPNYGNVFILSTILGSLPNLIGAFMFSLLPMSKALKLKLHIGRRIICISSISVFAILTYEEFFPYFTATKTFDYFDILASGIATSLAMIYFYFLSNMIAKGDLIK